MACIAERLRRYDSAAYTHTEGGVTFLEGCDPDGGRIIVARRREFSFCTIGAGHPRHHDVGPATSSGSP